MILLKVNNRGSEDGFGDGFGYGDSSFEGYGYRHGGYVKGNGYGKGFGNGYGKGFGNGDGNGNGYGDGKGFGDGNGKTNPTVTTKTFYSAAVLTVATQLITYYGGKW